MEGLGNVDQIREIIFGTQMRELDQRFTEMASSLTSLKTVMEHDMAELRTLMREEVSNATQLFETKLKNLSNLSREEREALREELGRTEKRLSMGLDSMAEEHEAKLALMKNEQQGVTQRLKEELHELKQNVASELGKGLAEMGDTRVSRDAMAEMLLEMAMKIKGEGLALATLDATE